MADPGEDPLIFRPNLGPKGRKKCFGDRPRLSQSLDDCPPTLSQGLDLALNIDVLLFPPREAAQSVYSRVFTDRYLYVR